MVTLVEIDGLGRVLEQGRSVHAENIIISSTFPLRALRVHSRSSHAKRPRVVGVEAHRVVSLAYQSAAIGAEQVLPP